MRRDTVQGPTESYTNCRSTLSAVNVRILKQKVKDQRSRGQRCSSACAIGDYKSKTMTQEVQILKKVQIWYTGCGCL